MQSTGTYISAIGHAGLIGWLILGWGFSSDPLDFEVTEISVVSSEEFAALVAATTPQPSVDAPVTPSVPTVDPITPVVPVAVDPPVAAATPAATQAPAQEAPPPDPPALPSPPTELEDEPPSLVMPQPAAVAAPVTNARPQPRPAPRIAPQPVAAPEPDTMIDDVEQPAATPDAEEPADVADQETDATAPQEAAVEVATVVDEPSGAVTASLRPRTRPNRQSTADSSNAAPEPDTSVEDDVVAAALAEALAAASKAPQGPPLTGSETEGFRLAVNRCWNVDLGSEAARVTVTVAFELNRDGRVNGSIRQVGASGGSPAATEAAFQSARRAILRCGARGYDLPIDKFDHWKEVEITFDPSGMRFR